MSLSQTYEAFIQDLKGYCKKPEALGAQVHGPLSTGPDNIDIPLVEQLSAALNGMTALAWPDQVSGRYPQKEAPGVESGEAAF